MAILIERIKGMPEVPRGLSGFDDVKRYLEQFRQNVIEDRHQRIEDFKNGVADTRAINTTSPLSGGGALTADLTLAVTGWAAWSSFTPSWTNLTVGNGTVVGASLQINKTTLYRVTLTFGSTTSIAGNVSLALPFTKHSDQSGVVGQVQCFDASPSGSWLGVHAASGPVRVFTVSGSYITWTTITSAIPFTWTTSDVLVINGCYEAA
jgi:hypothetical protein